MEKQKRTPRAPRFIVPNNEQAVLTIGAERLHGILHVLSMTGGTIRLSKRFPASTFADMTLKTTSGSFSGVVELLHTKGGYEQAFRFVAMGAVARARLTESLNKMRTQGFAIQKTPLDHVRSFAQRVLSRRSGK